MEGFEFECDNLYYTTIESQICSHYDLGFANSSSFVELSVNKGEAFLFTLLKVLYLVMLELTAKKTVKNTLYL